MKKFNYYFDYSPEAYNYIMQSKILRQSEKRIEFGTSIDNIYKG